MIRRPPRSTQSRSSAASDVYKRQVEELREVWRRSGGTTPRMGLADLTAWYERAIAGVRDIQEWRATRALIDPDEFVPRAQRLQLMALPGAAEVRGRTV